MSIHPQFRNISELPAPTPLRLETVEALEKEAIDALEREAEGMQPDRRQQFLASVRRYAGDILHFLDYMKVTHPFKVLQTAGNLFDELQTIGKQLAHATKENYKQFTAERSAYQEFRDFKLKQPEFSSPTRPRMLTWADAMEKSRAANAEMNVQQNQLLANMIRTTSEVLIEVTRNKIFNLTPAAAFFMGLVMPSDQDQSLKNKTYLKAVKIAGSPAVYRCFNKAGESVPSVPAKEVSPRKDVYFHATPLEKAFHILSAEKIKRLDLGLFKGAFVSSKPELPFGAVVFALNRSIEKGPVLNARFERGAHWVGFAQSIPVNLDSLEYVAVDLNHFSRNDIPALAAKFSQAAGREIQVKAVQDVMETLKGHHNDDRVCVPEEWPLTCEQFVGRWFHVD